MDHKLLIEELPGIPETTLNLFKITQGLFDTQGRLLSDITPETERELQRSADQARKYVNQVQALNRKISCYLNYRQFD